MKIEELQKTQTLNSSDKVVKFEPTDGAVWLPYEGEMIVKGNLRKESSQAKMLFCNLWQPKFFVLDFHAFKLRYLPDVRDTS